MENDNAATIAEVIDSHRQIPHNGGWTCAAKDCPWTYDDSPLPLAESAKHQADVIAKTLHPVAAPSVEQIEGVMGPVMGDLVSTATFLELVGAIHALYGTPGDSGAQKREGIMVPGSAYAEMTERAEKAEAHIAEMETLGGTAAAMRAENQRLRAALEERDELIQALESHHLTYVAYTSEKDRLGKNLAQASRRLDRARAAVEADTEGAGESDRDEADELACAWTTYRDDYGVHASDTTAAHKAFKAGWKAAREGDQSGVMR